MREALVAATGGAETGVAETAALGALTARMAKVLAAAHAAGRLVEDSYGDMIQAIPAAALKTVRAATDAAGHQGPARGLQELDRLVQVLDNLARFSAVLAQAIPPDLMVETGAARGEILLRDLARALLDPPGEPWPAPPLRKGQEGAEGGDDLCFF